jgi:hypothetical protein
MFWFAKWLVTLLAVLAGRRLIIATIYIGSARQDWARCAMELVAGVIALAFFAAVAYGMWISG